MATPRGGKPYLWVTWLSGLLGGKQCLWAAWFKSRFKYQKFEAQASQLAEWNREHSAMMRARRAELEENGWHVAVESENEFRLEGEVAIVAGKPDIIATMPGHVLVVDGKTGRRRDSDWWQVLIYLLAIKLSRQDLQGELLGEVHYQRGDTRLPIPERELTDARQDEIVRLIKVIGAPQAPPRSPSRDECLRCNIGFADCPERFKDEDVAITQVSGF